MTPITPEFLKANGFIKVGRMSLVKDDYYDDYYHHETELTVFMNYTENDELSSYDVELDGEELLNIGQAEMLKMLYLEKEIVLAKTLLSDFEETAIKWGKQYQIAKVGDTVTSYLGGKRKKKLKISSVSVTLGRNAQQTTRKTLVIEYTGRKLNAKGEFVDAVGCGTWLMEFETEDGQVFKHSENEVTETVNDAGLSFTIEQEPELKELYPNACLSYKDSFNGFKYTR